MVVDCQQMIGAFPRTYSMLWVRGGIDGWKQPIRPVSPYIDSVDAQFYHVLFSNHFSYLHARVMSCAFRA